MTFENKHNLEAGLALGSIALGVLGASFVAPTVLGLATASAVAATILKLRDAKKSFDDGPRNTGQTGERRMGGDRRASKIA